MHSLAFRLRFSVRAIALSALLVGCGQDAERPSEVRTLRVLAVRAETPFARPGTSVAMSLLGYDGSPKRTRADGTARRVSTLWIGGCNNPPGDNYRGCMPYVGEVLDQLSSEQLAGSGALDVVPGVIGLGETFVAEVPADIIASRQRAEDVVHPYGIQIVFFAQCGGVLRRVRAEDGGFPLGCYDADTGESLGRDDFEYGFYPLFVYDSVANQNPELSIVDFAGKTEGPPCSESAPCSDGYHCGAEQRCIPEVSHCDHSDEDDCPSYTLSLQVPRSSLERAVLARIPDVDAPPETLWISYYASGGSFEQDASMVSEPRTASDLSPRAHFRANVKSSGQVRLWAVARDNRNGVAWRWQDVWVR